MLTDEGLAILETTHDAIVKCQREVAKAITSLTSCGGVTDTVCELQKRGLATITPSNDDMNEMQAMLANVDCDTTDSIIKDVMVGAEDKFKNSHD
jgi:beta-phosphoglucomutase-like phosphatase (HAD superfamily)